MEPTERQKEVLETFKALQIEQGAPPSIRQVGERMGITSTNGTRLHLEALCKKGLLVHLKGRRGYAIPTASTAPKRSILESTKAMARMSAKNLPPEKAVEALLTMIESL